MSDPDNFSRRDFFLGRMLRNMAESVADELKEEVHERARDRILSTDAPDARRTPVQASFHRPPGAVDEADFLAGCTRCDDCIDACPPKAIKRASESAGAAAGTPIIDATEQPCVMCNDLYCVDVCEPGVLSRENPIKMASVRILPSACIAFRGVLCTSCFDRCPVPGALEMENRRPVIVQKECTGCGVCLNVCPAPHTAILLTP